MKQIVNHVNINYIMYIDQIHVQVVEFFSQRESS